MINNRYFSVNNVLIISWFVAVFLTNLIVFAVLIHKVQFRKKVKKLKIYSACCFCNPESSPDVVKFLNLASSPKVEDFCMETAAATKKLPIRIGAVE